MDELYRDNIAQPLPSVIFPVALPSIDLRRALLSLTLQPHSIPVSPVLPPSPLTSTDRVGSHNKLRLNCDISFTNPTPKPSLWPGTCLHMFRTNRTYYDLLTLILCEQRSEGGGEVRVQVPSSIYSMKPNPRHAKKFWSLELWKDTKDEKDVFYQRQYMSLMVSVPFLRKDSWIFGVFGASLERTMPSLGRADHLWEEPKRL